MRYTYLLMLALLIAGCNTARRQAKDIDITFGASKPTIIYQTTQDYSRYVPVQLSEDKSEVTGYPHRTDLYFQGNPDTLAYPLPLADGFWLDRRGINPSIAFLDMTYEEYANYDMRMDAGMLQERVQDTQPLVACYDCGNITSVEQLNVLIRGKALGKCKKLWPVE